MRCISGSLGALGEQHPGWKWKACNLVSAERRVFGFLSQAFGVQCLNRTGWWTWMWKLNAAVCGIRCSTQVFTWLLIATGWHSCAILYSLQQSGFDWDFQLRWGAAWVTAVSLGKSYREWYLSTHSCEMIGDFKGKCKSSWSADVQWGKRPMTSSIWSINTKFTIQYLSAITGAPVKPQHVVMSPGEWDCSQRRNW